MDDNPQAVPNHVLDSFTAWCKRRDFIVILAPYHTQVSASVVASFDDSAPRATQIRAKVGIQTSLYFYPRRAWYDGRRWRLA